MIFQCSNTSTYYVMLCYRSSIINKNFNFCHTEINRYDPKFSNSTPKFLLLKWTTKAGTMVTDINATDADPTPDAGRISYSLVSPDYQLPHILSNGTAEFEINATSGIITTMVDLETRTDTYSFYLTILAQDHGETPLSSTAQITILLLPVPHLIEPPMIAVDEMLSMTGLLILSAS